MQPFNINYAKNKIVKVVLKSHLLYTQNQKIGVKKIEINPMVMKVYLLVQNTYHYVPKKHIGLIVNVVTNITHHYLTYRGLLIAVHIVQMLQKNYVKKKIVKPALKTHLLHTKN